MNSAFYFLNFKYITEKIGLIQLKNIGKKNALNFKMLQEIHEFVKDLENKDQKIIIIESLCPKVFSSGHDLDEFYKNLQNSAEENIKIIEMCNETMLSIHKSNNVFISEISSQLVTAAGLQLASTCDLIVSSSDSKFNIPGSKIGLYAATPAVPLINTLPKKILFEMLFTGKTFTAVEMFKYGLINEIVESNEDNTVEEIKSNVRKQTLALCDRLMLSNKNEIKYLKRKIYNYEV